MPINAGPEYFVAEKRYHEAKNNKDKLKALQEMLAKGPTHKGSEKLRAGIKQKISKLREQIETQAKKRSGFSLAIKKEGAAQICLIGTTSSGKSTFLNNITNANAKTSNFPFTTTKPEIGTLDYYGIKIQVIEVPAITKDFIMQEKGGVYIGIIRNSDLLVIFGKNNRDIELVLNEIKENKIKTPYILFDRNSNMVEEIWNKLNLVKVYTKQPGKEKDYPPVAFKRGTKIKSLAQTLHKDFVKNFKYARVWGTSVKFAGQRVGYEHKLNDEDVVELHIK